VICQTVLTRFCVSEQIELTDLVYREGLRLRGADLSRMGVGGIANLQSNDVQKLARFALDINPIWDGPFQVGFAQPARCTPAGVPVMFTFTEGRVAVQGLCMLFDENRLCYLPSAINVSRRHAMPLLGLPQVLEAHWW
jgi:hypothetical protein